MSCNAEDTNDDDEADKKSNDAKVLTSDRLEQCLEIYDQGMQEVKEANDQLHARMMDTLVTLATIVPDESNTLIAERLLTALKSGDEKDVLRVKDYELWVSKHVLHSSAQISLQHAPSPLGLDLILIVSVDILVRQL